jgi:N6-L-threonylcarbamoyladenine synthase
MAPFVGLIVSGGHTCLLRVSGLGRYEVLGQTIDDAAGEAFDKGANLLKLGYPGGPVIDRMARDGDPGFVDFPRGKQKGMKGCPPGLDPDLCFSFSGVKTALLYYVRDNPVGNGGADVASVAASYQEAIVDALVERCRRAIEGEKRLAVVGGVSLNSRLRHKLGLLAEERHMTLLLPEAKYCADNAAMVAGLAGAGQGIRGEDAMVQDAEPNAGVP